MQILVGVTSPEDLRCIGSCADTLPYRGKLLSVSFTKWIDWWLKVGSLYVDLDPGWNLDLADPYCRANKAAEEMI